MRRFAPFLLGLALFLTKGASAADPVWERRTIDAGGRPLAAAAPAQGQGGILTIVIEGDGDSHDVRGRPTADPTPARAVGLEIARAWPTRPVAWLGRSCQYVLAADPACGPADWTDQRFSPSAIAQINAAIDILKTEAGAGRVRLVGWSGGGVIAMLAAEGRNDVGGIVTFAAPLDLNGWTRRHGLTPLGASLDPAKTALIPQVHYFGNLDGNVPPRVMRPFTAQLSGGRALVALRPERHDCCWPRRAAEASAMLKSLTPQGGK